jgi:hypothetical protein
MYRRLSNLSQRMFRHNRAFGACTTEPAITKF